jgi:tetratricopeptide (TPR) repeat protein
MEDALHGAKAPYQTAPAMAPAQAEQRLRHGISLSHQGRYAEAVAEFEQARRHRPDLPELAIQLCNELAGKGDRETAAVLLRLIVEADPAYAGGWVNLGVLHYEQGRYEAALACYERAQAIDPDFALAQYNEGLIRLLTGDFARGWAKYEGRLRLKEVPALPPGFTQPRWSGEDLGGGTLLLHAEQGFGDTIQFCRYVALAARRARVILSVPPPLIRLLSGLPGIAGFVRRGEPIPAFDRYCSLLSLPYLFGTTAETVPAEIPYLAAEPAAIAAWRDRLPPAVCRIGIVWQGNPKAELDRGRSFPLACFEAIARLPGVALISLQKGAGLEQVEDLGDRVPVILLGADFDEGPDAFIDTAAVIAQLDLVIACNSAVAHLAGALGRPVWLALRRWPDWRWLLDRDDSPWYPSMRLFRQARDGDWTETFDRIAAALPAFMAGLKR